MLCGEVPRCKMRRKSGDLPHNLRTRTRVANRTEFFWTVQNLLVLFRKRKLDLSRVPDSKLERYRLPLYQFSQKIKATWWRRGAVGRVSDLRSRGRGFESRPGTRRKNSGHVFHTYVPLFTKQYKLVPAKGR